MNAFYRLSSTTMNPCTMVKHVYAQARRTWLCTECGNPREPRSIDLAIQEQDPDNTPLNMVSGCSVGIARKDFLLSLGEQIVRHHLHLGQVSGPDQRPIDNWLTFVGRHRIIVRGSKNATVRRCGECGTNVYFAMGKRYLYPQPPPGISIFDAGFGGLVVTQDVLDQTKLTTWRKLDCTKLPLLVVPKDGLGDLKQT